MPVVEFYSAQQQYRLLLYQGKKAKVLEKFVSEARLLPTAFTDRKH